MSNVSIIPCCLTLQQPDIGVDRVGANISRAKVLRLFDDHDAGVQ